MTKIQILIDDKLKSQFHVEEKEDLKLLYLILRRLTGREYSDYTFHDIECLISYSNDELGFF